MQPQVESLFEAATRPYVKAGKYAWHFSRGKLRLDPVFFELLQRGLLPDRGRMYDLGCGKGILLALLCAARAEFQRGRWPATWLAPPAQLDLNGIELRRDRVRAAQAALGDAASVSLGDIREIEFSPCAAVVILDVLLYLDPPAQDNILRRAAAALQPGGMLLLREANASAGLSFLITQWCERIAGLGRGALWQRLHYRTSDEWIASLESLGFSVTAEFMSRGTPFANMLFVARRP
jgi:SAM-dependent methyltransferase